MDTRFPAEVAQHCIKGNMFHCSQMLHKGYTCEAYALKRSFDVLINASKFYGAVHLLPVIIFKLKKIRTEPFNVLKSYLKNVGKS